MYDEFNKCKFCIYHDEDDWCECACYEHENFKPNKYKLISTAKEKGISITDLLALINL